MWNPDLYQKALHFAARAHGEQKVPGTDWPYLTHITTVAAETQRALLTDLTLDQDLGMLAALLHDTVEDTPVTYEEVASTFGEKIAEGVLALTKDESLPKPEQMADSLQRILRQGPEIRIVKMADRITNLKEPPGSWKPEKMMRYREEAIGILETLSGVNAFIEARLAQKIEEYKLYFRR